MPIMSPNRPLRRLKLPPSMLRLLQLKLLLTKLLRRLRNMLLKPRKLFTKPIKPTRRPKLLLPIRLLKQRKPQRNLLPKR